MTTALVLPASPAAQLPALITASGDRASWRFMEFFTAAIRNPNTRRAYARDVRGFVEWCTAAGIASIAGVNTMHVAAYIEQLGKAHPAPTVKRHLAAIRHLFDYLATGGIIPFNPAAAVRGPKHSVKRGKTPVLAADEARQLLDAIDIGTIDGLRDRALIALMVYSFARVGAATAMRVEDVFTDQRRLWVRLSEKGGKRHEMPCHHNLEAYLHAWLDGSGLAAEPKAPLFPTIAAGTGRGEQRLTRRAITPREAHALVRKRARRAGETPDLADAIWHVQNRIRHAGRRIAYRSVGSTLLVKGLEFANVIVVHSPNMNRKDWYVALTRATHTVKVLSPQERFTPQA